MIEIIAVGNEVLYGEIINSNAAWISSQLLTYSYLPHSHLTIADNENQIQQSISNSLKNNKIVILTGGLGPTMDDFTVEMAAKTLNKKLILDEVSFQNIVSFLEKRGRKISENQKKQAYIPEAAEAIKNVYGTAPGVFLEEKGVLFFFLPGVPKEMQQMFHDFVLPKIKEVYPPQKFILTKVIKCFGAEEAKLDLALKPLFTERLKIGEAKIAFRLAIPDIHLKVTVEATTKAEGEEKLEIILKLIREKISQYIISEDEKTLEEVLLKLLEKRGESLAVAESCTGGLVSSRLTDIPGASKVLKGSVVAYSNEIKEDILGVSNHTLKNFGAVSEECVKEMVLGALDHFKSDWAIATTGIAGPGGGTEDKPVGLVFVAVAERKTRAFWSKKLFFPTSRDWFKKIVSSVAMNELRIKLLVTTQVH